PAAGALKPGMFITAVNDQPVDSVEAFQRLAAGNGTFLVRANGKDYSFRGPLGIQVQALSRTSLDLGLDLRGGTRIILKPTGNVTEESVEQARAILETRANLYGLREIKFTTARDVSGTRYIQIEAAGVSGDILQGLLSRQGNFEARIVKPVDLQNNAGALLVGAQPFPVTASNSSIAIQGASYAPNSTFALAGISWRYENRSGDRLLLTGLAYTGSDIELVYTDPQRAGFIPGQDSVQFYFAVLVSPAGAQRFADITTAIPSVVDVNSGEQYLDSAILLYLDGSLVSDLRISSGLGGQVVQTPQIQGSRATLEEATQERLQLQTILRSGALPVGLETVSVDVISPTLGSGFFRSALLAGLLAAALVVVVVFIRYRSVKVALPIAFMSLAEILVTVGLSATGDQLIWAIVFAVNLAIISLAWWKKHSIDPAAWVGLIVPLLGFASWTLDLAAIAGVIAAIGTGTNDQIIIADEAIRGAKAEALTMREKIKRAFFIVFGAAATIIAAMVPLLFIGVTALRGFAITAIIGVLVGILITRPAYAALLQRFSKE
ncbi:MAG TPA: hypothetical protein VJB16_02595, partial [archaeon]|nr:hypothetical protein [archaeon]